MARFWQIVLLVLGSVYGLFVVFYISTVPLACLDQCPATWQQWVGGIQFVVFGLGSYAAFSYAKKGATVSLLLKILSFLPLLFILIAFVIFMNFIFINEFVLEHFGFLISDYL